MSRTDPSVSSRPDATRTAGGPEIDLVDVVVVGGGACGMAAAAAAKLEGAEVLLLEKAAELGGNAALSTGSVPGAGTRFQAAEGVEDSPEIMARDIMRQAGYQNDRELLERLCADSSALVHWLVDELGAELYLVTDYKHVGHSVHRLHAPASREGADMVRDLEHALTELGVSVRLSASVTGLLHAGGEVSGVEVREGEKRVQITSEKVILASNGFAANRRMLRQYCPEIADVPYFGAPGNTGEGIEWAESLGASTEHMGSYQGYAAVAPNGKLVSWTTIEKGGVIVGRDGRRFADETIGYSAFTSEVQRRTDGTIYVIFDRPIMESVRDREPRFRGLVEDGFVRQATSIEELSVLYGIPGDNLEMTLARYAEAAESSGVDEFGRENFGRAPLKFPLYVAEASPGVFHTQGGVRVDTNARPIRGAGEPIGNLYAGGGVAVGISGAGGARGYASGNGLLTALGWGKIAGEHAARSLGGRLKSRVSGGHVGGGKH